MPDKPRSRAQALEQRLRTGSGCNMDYIVERLKLEITQYRTSTFDRFIDLGINAGLQPTLTARPLLDINGKWLGFDTYHFDTWAEPKPKISVRFTSNREVKIRHLSKWVAVSDYLSHIIAKPDPSYTDGTVYTRLNMQWAWWVANGKTFPLMDLPREIRDLIYEFTFGPRIEPYPTSRARRLGGRTQAILARQPTSALLRVNSQVKQEAEHILFLYAPFVVEHFRLLSPLLAHKAQRRNIRRLELAVSHIAFLKLFGFDISEDLKYEARPPAKVLREMKLSELVLHLAPPSLTTGSEWFDGACQRTVVDWTLEAAWQWVRGHPVRVTGYIKASQEAAFRAACLVERKRVELWFEQQEAVGGTHGGLPEYDEWCRWLEDEEEGGVVLGERRSVGNEAVECVEGGCSQAIEQRELPPKCRCKRLCTRDAWTAED